MTIKSPVFLAAMMFAGLAMSQSAEAREVQLQGHYSQSQVKAACDKAGGQDFEGEGVYGCENPGNGTSVYCDSKKCWGFVPDRLATGGSGTQASQVVKDPLLAYCAHNDRTIAATSLTGLWPVARLGYGD